MGGRSGSLGRACYPLTMPTDRAATLARITDSGLVAIIRADSANGLVATCRSLRDGGVSVVEITMTTPGALEAIAAARSELGDEMAVGVGSVLNTEMLRSAVAAGAQFVVCPIFKPELIDAAHAAGLPIFAGAFTPTEILAAFEAGSDVVKVFPAGHLGPKYFKDVLAPMPHLKLTPTGGVELDTVKTWLDAGAACLGVGSALVRKDLISRGDWHALTDLARQFVHAVKDARAT